MIAALLCVTIVCGLLWTGGLLIFARDGRDRSRRGNQHPKAERCGTPPALERPPGPAPATSGPPGGVCRFDLLKGLSDEQVDQVLAVGHRREIRPGEQLAPREDSVFLLLRGDVELSVTVAFGKRLHARVEKARPGERLGWMSLVPSSPWQPTARSLGDATVLEFPRDALLGLLASKPDLAVAVHSTLIDRAAKELHSLWLLHLQSELHGAKAQRPSAA